MSNKQIGAFPVSPAAVSNEQAQFVLIDIGAQFNIAANLAYRLSIGLGSQFLNYPSLPTDVVQGSIIQGDARGSSVLLAKNFLADLSLGTKQVIFTVPTGFSCLITTVYLHGANVSLATASFGFGFGAGAVDTIAGATHTGLTGPTLAQNLTPIAAAYTIGTTGQTFGLLAGTPQALATVLVDVTGFFF